MAESPKVTIFWSNVDGAYVALLAGTRISGTGDTRATALREMEEAEARLAEAEKEGEGDES